MRKLFLLSPAKITGVRAHLLLNPKANFELARTLQTRGLSLGETFAFASGLYFRGKLAYARQFAASRSGDLIRVITSNRGLQDPNLILGPQDLSAMGTVEIDPADSRYRDPLLRDASNLAAKLHPQGVAILLGSIATLKYRDLLLEAFGKCLCFPLDFIGRGDLSRGGLLLRATRDKIELPYSPVQGALLHGKKPARLEKEQLARPKKSTSSVSRRTGTRRREP